MHVNPPPSVFVAEYKRYAKDIAFLRCWEALEATLAEQLARYGYCDISILHMTAVVIEELERKEKGWAERALRKFIEAYVSTCGWEIRGNALVPPRWR